MCSIEPRHPFFDKRLVEYSVSLPWDQKVRHGWSKFLLRRACISQLPYEVVWRKEWAHIGRPLSSTLIQNMFSKIINFMKIQRKLFDQYVDLKFFDYIDNPVVPASNSDEELNILDIFLLAKWLYHSEHR